MACKEIKVKLQTFLIMELDGGEETASRSGRLVPWKYPTLNIGWKAG
jgi:hypothetical protein